MQGPARLHDFDHGITAIDTDFIRPGFDASHLILRNGRAAFVDTGPAPSLPVLLEGLSAKGIARDQVDYVLLTHVHLDHAGGAGALMQALPGAKAVIHPRGARHLIDPVKLIAGSIAVYGEDDFRRLYGTVTPIEEDRVVIPEDGERLTLGGSTLELIHTPGHAKHHYCIVDHDARGVFSGDTFGLSYRDFDTAKGEFIFPTTTPVHFDPTAAHLSIDRIMSYRPEAIYLTHYSKIRDLERLAADLHVHLDAFVAIAQACADRPDRTAALERRLYAYLSERLDAHGFAGDDARRRALLSTDVALNAQGIEVWLERSQAA